MQKGHNPIREFVDLYIESDSKGVILKSKLHNYYVDFCKSLDYPIKESQVFSRKMKPLLPRELILDEGQIKKGKTWKGIKCTYQIIEPKKQQELET